MAYFDCGVSQILYNPFPSNYRYPESYQIAGDWYKRFPPSNLTNLGGLDTTKLLLNQIHQAFPKGGKIVVGSEQFYINSYCLDWFETRDLLLKAQTSPYTYACFVNTAHATFRHDWLDTDGVLLFTHPSLQYSELVNRETWKVMAYSKLKWEKDKSATIIPVQGIPPNETSRANIGYLVVLNNPLTGSQVDMLAKITKIPMLPDQTDATVAEFDHRLTLTESWNLFGAWMDHRTSQ